MSLSHSPTIVRNGLVLYLDAANSRSYPGTGTTWTDLSGNGNNGTLTGSPTYSSSNNGSIVFDGANRYINLGTPSLLNGVQVPITIISWAYLTSATSLRTLWGVYKTTSGGSLYSLLRVDSGVLKYYGSTSTGSIQFQGTLVPPINNWAMYAVTVSGTIASPSVSLYINNSSETFSYSSFTSSPDLSVNFRVGGNQATTNENWIGNISNILWYNRALSAAEVSQNFNALRGRYGL